MQNSDDYLDCYLTNFSCFTESSCYAVLTFFNAFKSSINLFCCSIVDCLIFIQISAIITFFNRGGTVFSDGVYVYRNI